MEVNLFSAVELVSLVLPHMREQKWGRIISISSIYGREYGGSVDYMTAKAGLIAFSKHLALNLAPENVLVNCIAPGSIDFPGSTWDRFQQNNTPEVVDEFISRNLPGRQVRLAGAHRRDGGVPGVGAGRPDYRHLPERGRRAVAVAVLARKSLMAAPGVWPSLKPNGQIPPMRPGPGSSERVFPKCLAKQAQR